MAEHTPGPWGYTYDGSSDWSIGPAKDPQALAVAHVWDRNDDRARANVRLIAAAPELLDALKTSRGQWIHSVNAAQCLAAIAKAEEDSDARWTARP